MDITRPMHLQPTLAMIADSLTQAGCPCRMYLAQENQSYRGIRLYHGQQELQKDVLYLLRPEEKHFPVDEYSYLSTVHHPGLANHLVCPGYPDEMILDRVLEIFSQFQSWEDSIDLLLYRNASLQDLCELGAQLLENPVCIHDDWFVMMAMTADFSEIMEPEYLMTSTKGFVPRAVVEDFQNDSDYLETYAQQNAQLWRQPGDRQYTLYVNLKDGPVYEGRLLVGRKNRDFRPADYLLAEVLAQRAVMLLRNKQPGAEEVHQNMDDIVFALLQGAHPEPQELAYLKQMLQWQHTDRFLCLRLRHQGKENSPVSEHLLHSDLFQAIPGSYILLDGQEQCAVMNLNQQEISLDQLHHQLAPLCRDYCQYVGISLPVSGIQDLNAAYYQAGVALDQAFRLRNEKWILHFSDCAMDHILKNLPPPLKPGHLVSPVLFQLMAHDREHGTQYFETFRAYLLNERDIPKTSEALIIHRTTLLYRLKKIQSLIQTDLNEPWQRLYLTLSLWILEQEKSS